MKTIQIILPEDLLNSIDVECGQRNRSGFFRKLAEQWFHQQKIKKLEKQQLEGYKKFPVKVGEFDVWQNEQVWPE